MSKKIQKIVAKLKSYLKLTFCSAAANKILITTDGCEEFRSFSHLKKYQKRLRKFAAGVLFALIFLFIGILIGPALFNQSTVREVYIPDSKSDILIGNVSKDQATVVFKTLDARQNNPLATMAEVTIYRDSMHTNLVKKFRSTGYAVTHVIPVDGLMEGNIYYVVISASEDKYLLGAKETSSWGDNDPIVIYATGETVSSCASEIKKIREENSRKEIVEGATVSTPHPGKTTEITAPFATDENQPEADTSFKILKVQNENYLYEDNKLQVIISWRTNMPATSKLLYRYDDNGEKQEEITLPTKKTTKHIAVLTSLKTATKYYFKVASTNENGETITSEEYSLQTPFPKDTIFDLIALNFKGIVHQIGL